MSSSLNRIKMSSFKSSVNFKEDKMGYIAVSDIESTSVTSDIESSSVTLKT